MQAQTKDLLEFEYNEVNNHLERLFIITNSMKNTYKLYGQLIQADTTHNIDHFGISLFSITTIDSNNQL